MYSIVYYWPILKKTFVLLFQTLVQNSVPPRTPSGLQMYLTNILCKEVVQVGTSLVQKRGMLAQEYLTMRVLWSKSSQKDPAIRIASNTWTMKIDLIFKACGKVFILQ